MIDPLYKTGCASFDKATDSLSRGFARTRTQFSYRIPSYEPFDAEGRRMPTHVIINAKQLAPGGILHEFGNPATSRVLWRTHGWVAVDRAGAVVGCWSTSAMVSQKVIRELRNRLFAAPSVPIGMVRFLGTNNRDRAFVYLQRRDEDRQRRDETADARLRARQARQAAAESRRFVAETFRRKDDDQLDERLEALLDEA